jgi:secreted trypsin-like serine protease
MGDNVRAAEENEFLFIVAIAKYYLSNYLRYNYVCTGSLITKKDILTSAHCLQVRRKYGIVILVGSSHIQRTTRFYPEWWITFDQWAIQNSYERKYTNNDMAIIHVNILVNLFPSNIFHVNNI